MADQTKVNRADAQFKKLQKAEDGRKAMSDYEAEQIAIRARTEKLRALRLARDAAQAAAPAKAPAKKGAAKTARGKSSSATLSEWLKGRKEDGHQ